MPPGMKGWYLAAFCFPFPFLSESLSSVSACIEIGMDAPHHLPPTSCPCVNKLQGDRWTGMTIYLHLLPSRRGDVMAVARPICAMKGRWTERLCVQ